MRLKETRKRRMMYTRIKQPINRWPQRTWNRMKAWEQFSWSPTKILMTEWRSNKEEKAWKWHEGVQTLKQKKMVGEGGGIFQIPLWIETKQECEWCALEPRHVAGLHWIKHTWTSTCEDHKPETIFNINAQMCVGQSASMPLTSFDQTPTRSKPNGPRLGRAGIIHVFL